MKNLSKCISILLLGVVSLSLAGSWVQYKKMNAELEKLRLDNIKIEKENEILSIQLANEKLKYDSLYLKLDSSKNRKTEIEIRYITLKDSIRLLDLDESIIFLKEELEL